MIDVTLIAIVIAVLITIGGGMLVNFGDSFFNRRVARIISGIGGLVFSIGGTGVVAVVLFLAYSGVASMASSVSDRMEKEVVPISKIELNPSWDKERILVACKNSSAKGQIELLGRRTPTAFEVKAYRMKSGGEGYDLTRPAHFSLYQRPVYRSGPEPSFEFGNIRADGKWHSRRVAGSLSFSRGEYWLLDASLGSIGETGRKTLANPRLLEERCTSRIISF
jgi:hypothetical protein